MAVLAPDELLPQASSELIEVGFVSGPIFERDRARQWMDEALAKATDGFGKTIIETSPDFELYEWRNVRQSVADSIGGIVFLRAGFRQQGIHFAAYTLRGVPLPLDTWQSWYQLAFDVPWWHVPPDDGHIAGATETNPVSLLRALTAPTARDH